MSQLLAGLALLALGATPEAPAPPRRVFLALGTAKDSSSSCLKDLAAVFKADVGRRKGLTLARLRVESDVVVEVAACRTRTSTDTYGSLGGGSTFGGGDRTTWVRGELSGGIASSTKARLTVDLDDGRPSREFSTGPDDSLADIVAAALDGIEPPR